MPMTFTLGLDVQPTELYQGMDSASASVCRMLHTELLFDEFKPALPGSVAWTSGRPGVTATVRYACDRLAETFEEYTGVSGRLFVSMHSDKTISRGESINMIFSLAHAILERTTWDAGFVIDWEVGVLRRVRGEVFIDDIPELVLQGDTDELLQLLDPTGSAHRRLRRRLRP